MSRGDVIASADEPPPIADQFEARLLWMMGWETANIHLGSPRQRRAILADLGRRKSAWLPKAATRMGEAVARDWRKWCKIARDD